MSLTPAQELVIGGHVATWQTRIDMAANGMNYALERMRKLGENGFYIEDVILHAQMCEHNVRLMLRGYSCLGEMLETLGERNPYKELHLHKLDEHTMGDLVGKLKAVGATQSLITKAARLNGVRKEMVHHLFDGNRDIAKADKDAQTYIGFELPELIKEIGDGITRVNKQIGDLVDAYKTKKVVHPEGVEPSQT